MANMYGYNTSTARRLDIDNPKSGHNLHSELHTQKSPNSLAQKRTRKKSRLGTFGMVVAAFALAFVVVNGYVSLNEAKTHITELKSEYDSIVAANQAIQVKIDKTIDLKQLQVVAGEKFGMVRPERYQMFYIDLEMGDSAEEVKTEETVEKEGVFALTSAPGIITGALNIFQ